MGLKNEGSIVFELKHEHKDWSTNSLGYNFKGIELQEISAEAKKHPDKTVEIKIVGPFDKSFVFKRPIPPCSQRGLHIAMAWKDNEVKLYLNGKPEDSKSIEEAE